MSLNKILVSVIIPTYNPILPIISEALKALKNQTLDNKEWELIIVDNNSNNNVLDDLDLSWHPNSSIIKEIRQGLTFSRVCGFSQVKGEIIIMVDDDNVLAPDYLELVHHYFANNTHLGAAGGKIDGKFNNYIPAEWTREFWSMLAIRDLGDQQLISEPLLSKNYPVFAPVGAGMAIRRSLIDAYITNTQKQGSIITDRIGNSLSSGGDNEIIINVLKQNYSVGYFPNLLLQHIIPESRLSFSYLARLNQESSKSWIRLLLSYDICPWNRISSFGVRLRKLKAWLQCKAWKNRVAYIKWKGACGTFEGLAN